MAITQDWLATSPLAPWLFLSFYFFSFFCTLSLSPNGHQSLTSLLKTISFLFKCLAFSFAFVSSPPSAPPVFFFVSVPQLPPFPLLFFLFFYHFPFFYAFFFPFLSLCAGTYFQLVLQSLPPHASFFCIYINCLNWQSGKNQISERERPDHCNHSVVMTTRCSRAWRPLLCPSI